MRQDGEWGGNMELIAASKLFHRNILVYQSGGAFLIDGPVNNSTATTSSSRTATREDLIVSYHDNGHYNSVWVAGRKTMLIQPRDLTRINGTCTVKKEVEEETLQKNATSNSNKTDNSTNTANFTPTMSVDCNYTHNVKEEEELLLNANHNKKSKESTPKRNDLCSCGSGLKYKKCCLARQKQQIRLHKFKQKHNMQDDTAIQREEDEETMINIEGAFKVIKI
jgi:hypothetical protein